jgi:hypothetical protein
MTIVQSGFTAHETIHANARELAAFAGLGDEIWAGPFKHALVAALDRVQALPTPVGGDERRPQVIFIDGQGGALGRLIDEFRDPDAAGGSHPVPLPDMGRDAIVAQIDDAIALIEQFHDGYATVVHDLLCTVVVGTGVKSLSASLAHQIGTAFINPQRGWTVLDMAEQLLHESIHEAQYLDQMVHDWYTRPFHELIDSGIVATSPIRRVARPIPFVLQAATVGVAIMDLLSWSGSAAAASDMCGHLAQSLASVKQHEDLLSERGRQVLDELAAEVAASTAFEHLTSTVT